MKKMYDENEKAPAEQRKKDKAFQLVMADKSFFLQFVHFLIPELRGVTEKHLFPEKTDFIGMDLSENRSDVLYRIRYQARDTFVYTLIEHQSKVERYMSFRMTQYAMRIYEKYYKDRMKEKDTQDQETKKASPRWRFPPIIPIIYYDGEGKWTAPENMKELIRPVEQIDQYYLTMKSMVITLNKIPEEKLRELNNALGVYMLLNHTEIVKKYREKIFRMVLEMIHTLDEKEKMLIQMYILSMAQSVLKNITEEEQEELKNCKGVENSMQAIERIYEENYYKGKEEGIQQGHQKGRQEGRQEGKLESAIRFLERGTPIDQVAEILGFTREEILKFQKEQENKNLRS